MMMCVRQVSEKIEEFQLRYCQLNGMQDQLERAFERFK
jgi:hypothetical protein